MRKRKTELDFRELLSRYPEQLRSALRQLVEEGRELFVSGGTLRDLVFGRSPADLDVTLSSGSVDCCHRLREILDGGAFVMLGTEEEEAARLVWRGWTVDFSSFRGGASSIEEDLVLRDYTINAMALPLFCERGDDLIDPLGGLDDIYGKRLRCCPGAFRADPLRMLRGFRFMAELGFSFVPETLALIGENASLIARSAPERIQHEMDVLMSCSGAAAVVGNMASSGLLWRLYPELEKGQGMEQSNHHHKDVFGHSLLALECVDAIIAAPNRFFQRYYLAISAHLEKKEHRRLLRWAALFHDLGKPVTRLLPQEDGGRITFYEHDRVGGELFEAIAHRFRWSRADSETVALLVAMHMHPFHLCNSMRGGSLKKRTFLKLYKKAGPWLPLLFALSMADSLAGQGEEKTEGLEEELALLFDKTMEVVEKAIVPVVTGDRLITGDDLKKRWSLAPGPKFKEILEGIELARVEGSVTDRAGAEAWVEAYLACAAVRE